MARKCTHCMQHSCLSHTCKLPRVQSSMTIQCSTTIRPQANPCSPTALSGFEPCSRFPATTIVSASAVRESGSGQHALDHE